MALLPLVGGMTHLQTQPLGQNGHATKILSYSMSCGIYGLTQERQKQNFLRMCCVVGAGNNEGAMADTNKTKTNEK